MKILQVLVLIICLVVLANAQNKSRFCGSVIDEQNAALPNAIVEAKLDKGKTFKIKVDSEGNFDIEIPDGLYKILIKADGFKKVVMKNQLLPYDPRSCIKITLKSNVPPHQIS